MFQPDVVMRLAVRRGYTDRWTSSAGWKMLSTLAKKLRVAGAVVATVGAFVCTNPAQAALIQGDWDPAFGNPFPDLGWEGTVRFFVPDACLLESGTVSNQNSCSNGAMQLLTGRVDFYDLSNSGSILGSLFYTGNPGDQFLKITVSGGSVTGLTADFNQWFKAAPPVSIAGGSNTEFDLSFKDDCARLQFRSIIPGNGRGRHGYSDPCQNGSGPLLMFTNLDAQTVPEPGSLALLLTAAGGLLAASRRRKPAAGA